MCKMMTTGLVGLAPRRKRAGYTQASFAEALGIDRARLGMWEIGAAWPSASWLPAMADLLCCEIDDLYEVPEWAAETAVGAYPQGTQTPSPTETIIPDRKD